MTRLGLIASALFAFVALRSTASLAFPSSRLIYARGVGAELCPDETTMRKAVAQRLGYDPFFPAAEKTIVSQIIRDRAELRGSVQLVDGKGIVRGMRAFKVGADECEELVAAMSLAISIAIDPTRASLSTQPSLEHAEPLPREPGTAEKSELSRAQPSSPRESPDSASSGEPSPATHARFFTAETGLSLTTSVGTAPSPAMGASLSLGVRFSGTSLFLEGRRDLPASSDDVGGGRMRSSLWAVSVVPCLNRGVLFVCPVGSIGSMQGEGTDFAQPRTDRGLYAAAGGRIGLESRLFGPVYFRPQLDLLVTLARVELQLDGTTRWTAPPYSALLQAGLVAHFP